MEHSFIPMCLQCILLCTRNETAIPCSMEPAQPSTQVCLVLCQLPQASYFASQCVLMTGRTCAWSRSQGPEVNCLGRQGFQVLCAFLTVPALALATPSAPGPQVLSLGLSSSPCQNKKVSFLESFSQYALSSDTQ